MRVYDAQGVLREPCDPECPRGTKKIVYVAEHERKDQVELVSARLERGCVDIDEINREPERTLTHWILVENVIARRFTHGKGSSICRDETVYDMSTVHKHALYSYR